MTIEAAASEISYATNGVTTAFAIPFPFDTAADIVVVLTDTAGAPAVISSGFSISGGGGGLGTCTFDIAPAVDQFVTLLDDPEQTQPVDYTSNDAFPAETHEKALDRVTRLVKRMSRRIDRSLRVADGDLSDGDDLIMPLASGRANKFLAFDANGNPTVASGTGGGDSSLRSDLGNGTAGPGSLLVAIKRTTAETAAAVVPSNYTVAPYVRGRYANFSDWRLACDQAGAEGTLDADYAIVADTYLPNKCDFKGFAITGLFQTIHANRSGGYVRKWRASRPFIAACHHCEYTGVDTLADSNADKLLLMGGDGVGANSGTFWNKIFLTKVGMIEINADNFDVNQNTFYGGLSRYNLITGGGPGVGQAHANHWVGVDGSHSGGAPANSGWFQDDPVRSRNYITGGYYENGANIRGNFRVTNYLGDGSGPPLVDRHCAILGAASNNARLTRDFLPLSVHNLAVGGCWDIMDGTGKPPAFSNVGGASVGVFADTTEPSGCGYRYQCDFADAFDELRVTLQPAGVDRFACDIYFKSADEFTSCASLADAVSTSHDPTSVVVDAGNNWKKIRVSGPASKTAVTVIRLFAYDAVGGATKTMSLGGVFGGGENAIISPQRPTTRVRFNSAVYDPVPGALADGAGATTTVAVPGAALGDFALASFSVSIAGMTLTAWVSAADVVSVRFQNESGGSLDLASGTLRVQTQTPYA